MNFASDGSSEVPGNLGYWDQKEALEFISRNAASFGADPKRITITGCSAGSASTTALSISPHTREMLLAQKPSIDEVYEKLVVTNDYVAHDYSRKEVALVHEMELGVETGDLVKTLFIYALVSLFVFIEPPEFRSAGFTIEKIFYKLLGDRQTNFLDYQLRRITLTMISHILFFPGFFVVLGIVSEEELFSVWPTTIIQIVCSLVLLLASVALTVVGYLSVNNFESHYVTKKFRQFGNDWRRLSEQLSNQNQDFQIVVIRVESSSLSFLPFTFSIQSRNILQLIQDKVGNAFTISEDINLPLSKIDEFIPVFRACIAENESYYYEGTEELENCFGCMAVAPNVKISKRCDNFECTQCNCRPTWFGMFAVDHYVDWLHTVKKNGGELAWIRNSHADQTNAGRRSRPDIIQNVLSSLAVKDRLYWTLFTEYVQSHITKNECAIEFFVEGQRSRTSKSLYPKFGLVQVIAEPFLRCQVYDTIVVPVTINYDRLLESFLYGRLLKVRQILNQKFGNVFITFAKPISLRSYFAHIDRSMISFRPNAHYIYERNVKKTVATLAHEVVYVQNKHTILTLWPIAASIILFEMNKYGCANKKIVFEQTVKFYDLCCKLDLNVWISSSPEQDFAFLRNIYEREFVRKPNSAISDLRVVVNRLVDANILELQATRVLIKDTNAARRLSNIIKPFLLAYSTIISIVTTNHWPEETVVQNCRQKLAQLYKEMPSNLSFMSSDLIKNVIWCLKSFAKSDTPRLALVIRDQLDQISGVNKAQSSL
ncbi:PlsC domain-containing protein [Aphelenchoides besseyi]|nr:PlsC domain-containing protein [Aphelenchoides besseyi]